MASQEGQNEEKRFVGILQFCGNGRSERDLFNYSYGIYNPIGEGYCCSGDCIFGIVQNIEPSILEEETTYKPLTERTTERGITIRFHELSIIEKLQFRKACSYYVSFTQASELFIDGYVNDDRKEDLEHAKRIFEHLIETSRHFVPEHYTNTCRKRIEDIERKLLEMSLNEN